MSRISFSLLLLLSLLFCSLFISLPSFVTASDDDAEDSSSSSSSSSSSDDTDVDISDDEGLDVELDTDFDIDESSPSDSPASSNDDYQYNFTPHPDVSTSVYFPAYPSNEFEIGSEVVTLVGFSNTGSKTFNLTYAGANLLSPEDSSYYIQNFSVIAVNQLVEPGHEVTFEYRWKTAEQLEAAEYRFAAWVLYNGTEGGIFFNTYFNQTVEMKEKNKGILGDLGRLVTILCLLAAVGGGGYFAFNQATGGTKKKRKPRLADGEKKPAPEWEVAAYKPATKQRAFGAKKIRSNKKEVANKEGSQKNEQQEE